MSAKQMFQCYSDERSTSKIKDPAGTPTCSACLKPGSRKQDKCADLRSHVPESELPNCLHSPAWWRPMFPQWTRRQFVGSLPSHRPEFMCREPSLKVLAQSSPLHVQSGHSKVLRQRSSNWKCTHHHQEHCSS